MKINKEDYEKWALNHGVLYASESINIGLLRMWSNLFGDYTIILDGETLYKGKNLETAIEVYNAET